ncbi:MAG: YaaA family protein [Gudongella sp.]|nr:YaaA family protein [Gudongella sp.]
MKIIMSPSKTQSVENIDDYGREIIWSDMTEKLFKTLGGYSKARLGGLMKIKGDLLQETYDLYNGWSSDNSKVRAIDLYQGVAFDGIKYRDYSKEQKNYLDNSLLILSAMYGAVSPDTLIWPYRLDMTIKPLKGTLYSYWKDKMDDLFQDEDLVVNLASNEFARMVRLEKDKILNIHFRKGLGKESRRLSSYEGKKARGEMVGILAENLVNTGEGIRSLAPEDYKFDQELSDENNYYYGKME